MQRAASDREYDEFDGRRSYAARGRANVRFYDDMDTPPRLHQLHQTLRDVSSDQLRLEDDLNREIHRRNRSGQMSKNGQYINKLHN